MLRTTKTLAASAATAACGSFAITAHAESMDDLIPAIPGTEVLLTDENREELVNREGGENTIDVGDSLRGVFGVEQLFVTTPGDTADRTQLLHMNGNSEISGSFQIEVVAKNRIGEEGGRDVYQFVFGVDDDFADDGQTLVKLWEDEPGGSTYFNELDGSKSEAFDVTTDGDLWLTAGITGENNYWIGEGFDDITLDGPPSFRIGESIFALDRTGGSFNLELATIAQGVGSGEFVGTSNIGPGLPGSAWELSSNTNFNFRIIPTPAAFAPGVAMLAMALVRRRRA